ncbi:MAG: [protein-PII] uridylyltransferase [Parvularculaceae bacterium]
MTSETAAAHNKTDYLAAGAIRAAVADLAARERAGKAHGAVSQTLKTALAGFRRSTLAAYARGDRLAARLASGMDEAVEALFETGAENHPEASNFIAICAVGGFGRGLMAPYSDVDLLVLHEPVAENRIRPLLDQILYPLWDSGAKVGHAVHTPASAVNFAKSDMTARTAFLDARFICGARALYDDFHAGYEKLRKRTIKEFVAAKLEEQDARHIQSEESRHLVEPDVKEGKGGLRDLQTIYWIYKYAYGGDVFADPKSGPKTLREDDLRATAKAARFLWSVRANLHDLRGRADERLAFDIQPQVAERLGYSDRSGMTAAERLMKHYFVNAVEVGRLTRLLCAKLEEEQTKRLARMPKLLPRMLLKDEAPGKPNLRLKNGRLDFESAARARRRPIDFFRLFRAFAKRPDFDFHPDALAVIAEEQARITSEVRRDPTAAALFKATLTKAKDPLKTLRVMAETGLLAKYLPSFGKTIGRIEYGLYRRFTLDEHVLHAIAVLTEIDRGEAGEEHPIATGVLSSTKDRTPFYLAVLFHELIWTVKNRSIDDCERLVVRISKRLGLNDEDAALVGWCAARRLFMMRTAERRNLDEAEAIAQFARTVGDRRRLDILLVLSVCHLRVVGLNAWDEWTRGRLTELYHATLAWLEGGEEALARRFRERAYDARMAAEAHLADWPKADRARFFARASDAMLRVLDPEMITKLANLMRTAEEEDAAAAIAATPQAGDVEAIILADDRSGLLADLAGAVASANASVRAVHAFTSEDGKAIDIFTIQSLDGTPLEEPRVVERLRARLLEAARAAPKAGPSLGRRLGDRRALFNIEPVVRLDLEASKDCVVVEAEGLDRPGLLFQLTSALSEIGVTILSAHVATYGARAVDSFYLQDAPGYKITNKRRLQSIERRLYAVLSAGG